MEQRAGPLGLRRGVLSRSGAPCCVCARQARLRGCARFQSSSAAQGACERACMQAAELRGARCHGALEHDGRRGEIGGVRAMVTVQVASTSQRTRWGPRETGEQLASDSRGSQRWRRCLV